MTETYEGQLEIDSRRGVIYFHNSNGSTLLRICGLPTPITNGPTTLLDITCRLVGATGFSEVLVSWMPKGFSQK